MIIKQHVITVLHIHAPIWYIKGIHSEYAMNYIKLRVTKATRLITQFHLKLHLHKYHEFLKYRKNLANSNPIKTHIHEVQTNFEKSPTVNCTQNKLSKRKSIHRCISLNVVVIIETRKYEPRYTGKILSSNCIFSIWVKEEPITENEIRFAIQINCIIFIVSFRIQM